MQKHAAAACSSRMQHAAAACSRSMQQQHAAAACSSSMQQQHAAAACSSSSSSMQQDAGRNLSYNFRIFGFDLELDSFQLIYLDRQQQYCYQTKPLDCTTFSNHQNCRCCVAEFVPFGCSRTAMAFLLSSFRILRISGRSFSTLMLSNERILSEIFLTSTLKNLINVQGFTKYSAVKVW